MLDSPRKDTTMQLFVTPTTSRLNSKVRYLLWFPKEVKSMLGDFVAVEGTLERGLVMKCNVPPRRGRAFSVQDNPKSSMLHVEISEEFGKATEPKIRTPVKADSTTIDGQTVIVLDRIEPSTWPRREPRRLYNRERSSGTAPSELPAELPLHGDMEAFKAALAVLKRKVRDEELAKAIQIVIDQAPRLHATVGWNGTHIIAQIIQRL